MIYIYIIICTVIIMLLLVLSKASYTRGKEEKRVDVLFTASLPQELQSCSHNGGELIDVLTVGVYDSEGNELIRKTTQEDGAIIDFKISLAKQYTYNIVLWTHCGESDTNNIGDMKSIKMLITDNVSDFTKLEQLNDFYTTCEVVSANQSSIHTVELASPLTKINVDTTVKDAKATLKIFGVPPSFQLFIKEMSRSERVSFDYDIIPSTALFADNVGNNCPSIDYLFSSENRLAFDSDANR